MSSILVVVVFFFQAEDGIRDLVRSRGLGDVYKRQPRITLFNLSKLFFCAVNSIPSIVQPGVSSFG